MSQTQNISTSSRQAAAVILAAGKSTRMKTELPKVMHEICGQPMLSYVFAACREAGINQFHVVVGFAKDAIIRHYENEPGVRFVEQKEQKGTGHAVSMCEGALRDFGGDVIVIAGDMPMIRAETLKSLLQSHRAAAAGASIATTVLADPTSYGRIVRNSSGDFERIVEHRDCTPEQLKINEVNPSYYCFDCKALLAALPKVQPNNAKGEYYITDVLEIIKHDGLKVRATTNVPAVDAVGINSRVDLADVTKLMQRRIQNGWMEQGITIVDPDSTWIDSRAQIGIDSEIKPFSYIEGRSRIGARCVVGPYAYVGDGAVIEEDSIVGPGVLSAIDTASGGRKQTSTISRRPQGLHRQPPVASERAST
ncbi:MAG: bifunctional N-acetylglucosamine-1-phosphate uridyltransferase/glucosamine-1-phosphate acetyltransferase [Planctomycetes bacterium]|nr:bifunctional N-acetylglucosamine-1-phosphate uridyltransferase/glucosamine-1-phosphate acetyltransferase [Planctomycetota bacterium]